MFSRESIRRWAEMTKEERELSPEEQWVKGRRLYFMLPETGSKCTLKGEGVAEVVNLFLRWGYIPCSYFQYHLPAIFKLKVN